MRILLTLLVLLAVLRTWSGEAATPWPLDITHAEGVITVYQPQPEKLSGNVLTGRFAASFLANGKDESGRTFGAVWFSATLDIDREADIAKARSLTLTRVMTPKGEMESTRAAQLEKVISEAILAQGLTIDMDRLAATLEEVQAADIGPVAKAPRILVRKAPTLLVVCDGEPQWRALKDGVQRIVNTPVFVVRDAGGSIWLRTELDWLNAEKLSGPWQVPKRDAPLEVVAAAVASGLKTDVARVGDGVLPEVIIANGPTEVLEFAGSPQFKPIGDGALLAAANSETDVLVEVATGKHWVLLAGRWFRTGALSDEAVWEVVAPDALPAAFAALPATAEFADLRAHVAGTDEAREAAAMAQVPQTARIPRSATITVSFDGKPRFVAIEGSPVQYAENTADAVFLVPGGRFYCCRDGVWYEAAATEGPWQVATTVPEALYHLPKSCPWYNCSAVRIYESDTQYVWCGYTPAYTGCYVWAGCPVYGTGYYYPGYWGPGYYPCPRPITWGVAVRYNPWTGGWMVGIGVGGCGPGWSVGIVVGGYPGGWWGPVGYPPRPPPGYRPPPPGMRPPAGGVRPPGSASTLPARAPLYDRVPGAERPNLGDSATRLRPSAGTLPADRPAAGAGRPNDLMVDRDGQIVRPNPAGGWQQREQGGWKNIGGNVAGGQLPANRPEAARPTTTPATRPEASRPAATPAPRPSHDQSQYQRQRGETRVQQRAAPSYSRPATRSGGGGGGRRR